MSHIEQPLAACVQAALKSSLDKALQKADFARKAGTVTYEREHNCSFQQIVVAFEMRPSERPGCLAVIYPWMHVRIDAVENMVAEMVGGDAKLLPGLGRFTLSQPIEFASAKAMAARWYVGDETGIPEVVDEVRIFVEQWVLDLLDTYSSQIGMCDAFDRNDQRISHVLSQRLRTAAAMLMCGRYADAVAIMDRWFGAPGPRRRYRPVFDYLESKRPS